MSHNSNLTLTALANQGKGGFSFVLKEGWKHF
jgi:hypothetical protein